MHKSQIKFGVVFSYINVGLTILVSLLFTPILIRMLGQKEYGLYSIAFAAIGIFSILDMGLGNANIRYTAKYRAEHDSEAERSLHGMFLVLYLCIGLLALIAGLAISSNTSGIFGREMTGAELSKLHSMFTIVVVSLSLSFPLSVFGFIVLGYERFVFAKLIEFLRILLVPLLSLIMLLLGKGSVAIIAVIATINIGLLLVNLIYCLRVLKIRIKIGRLNTGLLKEILTYSFFVFLGVLAFHLNNNSNQFVLGMVAGPAQVAIYALGFNLVINFYSLSAAITSVFLPTITKLSTLENRATEFNNFFKALGRLQFYVIALFYLGFLIFGKLFISLWAGAGYEASYYVCIIPLSSFSIYLIQTVGISIMQAQNRHAFSSVLFAIMAILNIVVSFFLSIRYGATGAALSITLIWLLGHGVTMNIYYSRKIKLDVFGFWRGILQVVPAILPSTIIGFGFLYFFKPQNWLGLFAGLSVFSLTYAVCVVLFSFNQFEKDTILLPATNTIRKLARVF